MIDWILGMCMGFWVHEMAHVAVSYANQGEITFTKRMTWRYKGKNEKQVAVAGLLAQAISSEILIRRDHQTNFTKGWLTYNVGNTFMYTIRHESSEYGFGDYTAFTQNEARALQVLFVSHSISVAHRMKWNFFPTRNGFQMMWKL